MSDQESARARLEARLLGDPPVFTLADVESKTGIPASAVRRLWRALGFAIPERDEPAFNESDLNAIRMMNVGVHSGVMDIDTEVRLARAVGQTTSRLADWQATTFLSLVDDIERSDQASGSRAVTGLRVLEAMGDTYDDLLMFAWKRHLGAAVSRLESVGEVGADQQSMTTKTVGFADLVQFSALSNELDDDRIGDLVEIFETRATDVVTNHGGRVIKTLGDSVLFLCDDVASAMETAHRIIDVIGRDSRLPDVRLGLATGTVIMRFGDVFGPPVNLAARLTNIARRNRVICDDFTARLLSRSHYETRALTARPVRGFGVLEPMAVRRI